MGLNFVSSVYLFITSKIRLVILLAPTAVAAQSTNLPDMLTRVLVDDSYINTYYFFWTNFWYLPLFFGSILLLKVVLLDASSVNVTLIMLLLLGALLTTAESVDYMWVNTQLHSWGVEASNFNILLMNSINKYHPFLLYYCLITLFILLTSSLYLTNYRCFHFTQHNHTINSLPLSYNTLILLTTTLYLGAWWAVQEGSWGGWWNWDPSEVFGLVVMGFFVRRLHLGVRPGSGEPGVIFKNPYTKIILLLYIFIQINFDLVSHNFGTKSNIFVDPVYTYVALFFILLVDLVYRLNSTLYLYAGYLLVSGCVTRRSTQLFRNHNIILSIPIIVIIYLSFIVLLNDFMWKFFTLNVWNSVYIHLWFLVWLWFLLTLRLWSTNLFTIVCLMVYASQMNDLLITSLLMLLVNGTTVHALHLLLWVFLLSTSLNNNKTTNHWGVAPNTPQPLCDYSPSKVFESYLSYTNSLVESFTPNIVLGRSTEASWGFVYADTSLETRIFSHLANSVTTEQSLSVGNNIFNFIISTQDNSLIVLSFLMLTTLTLISVVRFNKLVIIY